MLGVAIVGCGMIARFHVKALSEVPGTRVVALIDKITPLAEKMKADLNLSSCTVHAELDEALKRKDVDMVIVSTPSGAQCAHQAEVRLRRRGECAAYSSSDAGET